jgi:hypothetical protein
VDLESLQRGDRAPGGVAEADDGGGELPTVVTCGAISVMACSTEQ